MVKKQEKPLEDAFDRESLMQSEQFAHRKDALAVLIADGETITVKEAQARIEQFMKERA